MITFQVRISMTPVPAGFAFSARGFIDSTDSFLKKTCGGSCVGVATDGQIAAELLVGSRDEVSSLIESYCDHFRKEQRQVQIVVIESPTAPIDENERAAAGMLNTTPKKLTKAFFMQQTAGSFLASNLIRSGFTPVFAESIGPAEARAAQWERIREAGADQRACYIFPSEADYQRWHQRSVEFFRSRSR